MKDTPDAKAGDAATEQGAKTAPEGGKPAAGEKSKRNTRAARKPAAKAGSATRTTTKARSSGKTAAAKTSRSSGRTTAAKSPAKKAPASRSKTSTTAKAKPEEPVAQVLPTAVPARMKRRHWGVVTSFFALVLVPLAAAAFYLWSMAGDQYASVTGFTVRSEENAGATALLGGLAQLAGSNVSSDGDILYEFILSPDMVSKVDAQVGLITHYGEAWETDPVFSIWPDAKIEDLEWFWKRIVSVSYDQATGLMEVEVVARTPEKAQEIARAILSESQAMINALNIRAREDAMRYALEDLASAEARLKSAREALTTFRSRTQILDPEADIQSRLGVMANLQQQLAQALIEYDLLSETTNANDPRLVQAQRRIEVIRTRIADERESFAHEEQDTDVAGETYPNLIAEYEGLVVDREFAEETYRAALASVDAARAQASRQSRYLATYVQPTLAQTPEYPRRMAILGLIGLFLVLTWSILSLVYYSIRDRS